MGLGCWGFSRTSILSSRSESNKKAPANAGARASSGSPFYSNSSLWPEVTAPSYRSVLKCPVVGRTNLNLRGPAQNTPQTDVHSHVGRGHRRRRVLRQTTEGRQLDFL